MDNLWEFLLQTLNGSLVAMFLLLIKQLLADKLSPRWQYGIWGLLALRLLLPSNAKRSILLPLPLWLETWKGKAEKLLDSVLADAYIPISADHGFPILKFQAKSLTDWLFLVYVLGVIFCLIWYFASYVRLRLLLHKGMPANPPLEAQLKHLEAAYGLKSCRVVQIPGLPAPFICGICKPVLSVPAGDTVNDKVLLHELLHLKHKDALQSVGWSCLRCLHWCNPLLQYVFYRIGNDMESLCDQRVLERLDGEERREYGAILLKMASDRYARAPGTTSISNGGKNIARRIEAIVRFKQYPHGMALVSICIALCLVSPILFGTANAYETTQFHPGPASHLDQAMAAARITRCSTLAGALDTYAKGLMTENGILIAAASPLSTHEALEAEMRTNIAEENWVAYHLDSGDELTYVVPGDGYLVYNLKQVSELCYQCYLGFSVSSFLSTDGNGWQLDEEGNILSGSVLIPVQVRKDGDWVVEETRARICSYTPLEDQQYLDSELPAMRTLSAAGNTGTIMIQNLMIYQVNNSAEQNSQGFYGASSFDTTPKMDAAFYAIHVWKYVEYTCPDELRENGPEASAGLQVQALDSAKTSFEFEALDLPMNSSRSSSDGSAAALEAVTENWDGRVISGSGNGYYNVPMDELPVLDTAYTVQVLWDGEVVEEFLLQEEP